jgi:hypothetical protein
LTSFDAQLQSVCQCPWYERTIPPHRPPPLHTIPMHVLCQDAQDDACLQCRVCNGDEFASGKCRLWSLIDQGQNRAGGRGISDARRLSLHNHGIVLGSKSSLHEGFSGVAQLLNKRSFGVSTFDSCGAIASRPQCPMGAWRSRMEHGRSTTQYFPKVANCLPESSSSAQAVVFNPEPASPKKIES